MTATAEHRRNKTKPEYHQGLFILPPVCFAAFIFQTSQPGQAGKNYPALFLSQTAKGTKIGKSLCFSVSCFAACALMTLQRFVFIFYDNFSKIP